MITLPFIKSGIPLFIALVAAGLAGNYFKFSIFLNIDFLFGSIFAMLALQFFGLGRSILAAAMIAGYTYILWNHPYAVIIMTAEVAVVGWLMNRRKIGMVLSDTLYWLIIGMPLAYLFYHLVMHVPAGNTYIVMIKQAVNGVTNALVARLLFNAYALRSRSTLISYNEIVFNLLAFFVLCPALIMLAIGSRTDFAETDRQIRSTLKRDCGRLTLRLETWVLNRKSAILNLAEMAASRTPQQMQPYLEMVSKSDINFLRTGILDSKATTTAFFPMFDDAGNSNIGKSYADRNFIPQLKQTLKPMLSEVSLSRVGTPTPRVAIIAPILIQGAYGGYAIGVLDLKQIREHLDKITDENSLLYTLLDKNGNIIMTNRTDQKVMTPLVREKGTLNRLDKDLSQWIPVVPGNVSIMERFRKSFYVAEAPIGNLAEWKLILEQPVAPYQKRLYEQYTGRLSLLFLILLLALALAEFLSRKIVATLVRLRTLTYQLPVRLAADGNNISWPESGIKEAQHLINNFREMECSLSGQFNEIRQINESLEQRVDERTKELRESEERYRNFFENNRSVMLVIDPDSNRIVDSNPAASIYYGWSQKELSHKMMSEINTFSQEEVAAEIELAKNQSRDCFFFTHRRADGTVRDVEVYTGPIKAKDKTFLLSIVHDITARKQAEAEREQFLTFFNTSGDLMCIADPNGAFMKTNPACTETLGYTEAELLSKPFIEFIHPDDKQATRDEMKRQLEIGHSLNFENRYICKDGSVRWLSWRATYDKAEGITYATARDFTSRKQAEEKLRKSEGLYHSLVETSQDLIWQCDIEGRYTYLNLAWEQVFGYELHEMLGRKFSDFQTPACAARDQIEYRRIIEGNSVHGFETTHIGKSGNEIHLVFNALFMCDEHGNIVGTSGTAYDITERKKMEQGLLEAKAAAEAASIAKSQFLANMSHEIRTPMNGVIGLIEMLLATKLDEEQRKYAKLAVLSGRNLVQLINDILDLSKIEAHKIQLENRDFDLQVEANGAISLLSLHAQEKGLELSMQIDQDVPLLLRGDSGRLRQILNNLIGNAIKFTSNGSIHMQIQKDCEDEATATLRFFIRDTGIGIGADKLGMIFESFTQADGSTTRKYGGTGLGLTISRQLAELMGGTIGVESREGEGSTFWFTVVLLKQMAGREKQSLISASGRATAVLESLPATGGKSGKNLRLLLAEDDQTNQLVTKSILSKFGYQVDVANNGREALKLLENNDYALVLLDCMMPVMNGYEAVAVIRDKTSNVRNHSIPVIALTANAMVEDRDMCLAAGMDDYLAKPLEAAELLKLLEKWTTCISEERDVKPFVSTIEIFDMDEFVKRNLGDFELSRDVALIFSNGASEYIDSILNALAAQDAAALLQSAHKLKGAAANLALPRLSETAAVIETLAKAADFEHVLELLPELEKEFEQALDVLREQLISPQEDMNQ